MYASEAADGSLLRFKCLKDRLKAKQCQQLAQTPANVHQSQSAAPPFYLAQATDHLPDARAVDEIDAFHIEDDLREIPPQKIVDLVLETSRGHAGYQSPDKVGNSDARTVYSDLDCHRLNTRNARQRGVLNSFHSVMGRGHKTFQYRYPRWANRSCTAHAPGAPFLARRSRHVSR
jgi:hypothetical protein